MNRIKKAIGAILDTLGIDKQRLGNYIKRIQGREVIYNVNNTAYMRRCLLIYITAPFISHEIKKNHQNQWQAREMARLIGEHGYNVDVVEHNNKYAKLKFNYDLVIGLIPRGIDIYSKHLNPGCIRIAYLTSMNLIVTSGNEIKRLEDLKKRRGVQLKPRRVSGIIQKEIENFDAAWHIGNAYNLHSYDVFKMPPSFFIKNSGYTFDWASSIGERSSKSFVFFGSMGAVHKGLDLLLEIFSEDLKDCTLYACGGYVREQDFCKEYHNELFETPNIIPMGFVDVESDRYKEMALSCAYTLLPSCAEACAGSVLTNMSAGLIPIVSKECGFEDDEVINLEDCRKETILKTLKEYSTKDRDWILQQSQHSINIVKQRYMPSNFTHSVESALNAILK